MEVSCVPVKITLSVMDSTALLYVRMDSDCQEEMNLFAVSVFMHYYNGMSQYIHELSLPGW